MDERAFQDSRRMLNPSPCVFERAILADCAQCELARRRALAEREVVACSLEVARINCMTLESLFEKERCLRCIFPARVFRSLTPKSCSCSVEDCAVCKQRW